MGQLNPGSESSNDDNMASQEIPNGPGISTQGAHNSEDENVEDNILSNVGSSGSGGTGDQTISAQIEVTEDENKNNFGSSQVGGTQNTPSSSVDMQDGFTVGGGSIAGDGTAITEQEIAEPSNDNTGTLTGENNGAITTESNASDNGNEIGNNEEEKYQVLSGSLFDCPAPGFYPHEKNCVEFYVCLELLPNKLSAEQLYKCPNRYLFDEVTRRCQKEEKVNCTKFMFNSGATLVKESENVFLVLDQFLDQFFNTSLMYKGP